MLAKFGVNLYSARGNAFRSNIIERDGKNSSLIS